MDRKLSPMFLMTLKTDFPFQQTLSPAPTYCTGVQINELSNFSGSGSVSSQRTFSAIIQLNTAVEEWFAP